MMVKEGYTKIMTPEAGFFVLGRGHICNFLNRHWLFKDISLYPQVQSGKIAYMLHVMKTKEGSTEFFFISLLGIGQINLIMMNK